MKSKQRYTVKKSRPERKVWHLKIWNQAFADPNEQLPPMSNQEITEAIDYLRKNNYPKPEDCPSQHCRDFRPACNMGVCRIAVGMCGDF